MDRVAITGLRQQNEATPAMSQSPLYSNVLTGLNPNTAYPGPLLRSSVTSSSLALPVHHSLPILMRSPAPGLTVNKPGDPFEQEAERVADQVMRMPEEGLSADGRGMPAVRHRSDSSGFIQCLDSLISPSLEDAVVAGGSPQEQQSTVQTLRPAHQQSGRETVSKQRLNSSQGGMPLDAKARRFMESRFQFDFSEVQVHADSQAAALCDSVNARAFTYGPHIYFGAREYQPDTAPGRHVLAHELTHVVQQGASHADTSLSRSLPLDQSHTFPRVIQRLSAPGRVFGEDVAPWGGGAPTGRNLEVTTDAGSTVTGWEAYSPWKYEWHYWCHGHSTNSVYDYGYSVYSGSEFRTVVADEYTNIPPAQTRAGDIAVWTNGFNHSARFTEPAIDGGQLVPERSLLSTKNGKNPLAVMTLRDIIGVYGGAGIGVFRHR